MAASIKLGRLRVSPDGGDHDPASFSENAWLPGPVVRYHWPLALKPPICLNWLNRAANLFSRHRLGDSAPILPTHSAP